MTNLTRELLSNQQYGFRQGRNTDLAVFDQVSHICEGMEAGDKVVGVFLDLAKAFDTVNHRLYTMSTFP